MGEKHTRLGLKRTKCPVCMAAPLRCVSGHPRHRLRHPTEPKHRPTHLVGTASHFRFAFTRFTLDPVAAMGALTAARAVPHDGTNCSPPDLPARAPAELFFVMPSDFRHAKDAFGYHHPNFDPVKLADAVCAQQGWLNSGVRFYTGTPSRTQDARWHGYWNRAAGPAATSSRGINRTDWVPLDRTLYDGCLIRGITGGRTGKAYTPGRRQGRSDGYQLLRSTGVLPSESRASGSAPAASSASTIPEDRWYRA